MIIYLFTWKEKKNMLINFLKIEDFKIFKLACWKEEMGNTKFCRTGDGGDIDKEIWLLQSRDLPKCERFSPIAGT